MLTRIKCFKSQETEKKKSKPQTNPPKNQQKKPCNEKNQENFLVNNRKNRKCFQSYSMILMAFLLYDSQPA